MYALIVPASTPFVLLATVLGLSWWEDRLLPTPAPVPAPAAAPLPQLLSTDASLPAHSPDARPESDARSPVPPRPRPGRA